MYIGRGNVRYGGLMTKVVHRGDNNVHIRISVGIENGADLPADLWQALELA
jgi:O-acetylhomoserine/O-acetylserine sulfhydrylase-like pyridoxal-dependent enzyme